MSAKGAAALLLAGLALAACGGPGPWSKEGVSPKRASIDYADCRSQAQNDIRRDVDIDTDIAAGRKTDWDKSQSGPLHKSADATANNSRSYDVVRACMLAKGYIPNGRDEPASEPHMLGFLGLD